MNSPASGQRIELLLSVIGVAGTIVWLGLEYYNIQIQKAGTSSQLPGGRVALF